MYVYTVYSGSTDYQNESEKKKKKKMLSLALMQSAK